MCGGGGSVRVRMCVRMRACALCVWYTTINACCVCCSQLLASTPDSCGGDIILISDGEENRDPRIADVIDDITAACVRVDSLLYTANAEPAMVELAEETGGRAYFATGEETATDLLSALLATESEGNSPVADAAIQVSMLCLRTVTLHKYNVPHVHSGERSVVRRSLVRFGVSTQRYRS